MGTETRSRRRIRMAVESRGRTLVSLEWQPITAGCEMGGPEGGWYGLLEPMNPNHPLGPYNDVMGYNVDEAVAWVDHFLKPPSPCDCDTSDRAIYNPMRSDRCSPLHEPACRWYLRYELPWWSWHREHYAA